MVLQASCRCLRQVDKEQDETALIWLNKDNADTLNKQLKQEQNSSIEELNNAKRSAGQMMVTRHSRMNVLRVPKIDFYQMRIGYLSTDEELSANTRLKLKMLIDKIDRFKNSASVSKSGIADMNTGIISTIDESGETAAHYQQWVYELSRQSFGLITKGVLLEYDNELSNIFSLITYTDSNQLYFNSQYNLYAIESKVRAAFSIKRDVQTTEEAILEKAELLVAGKLSSVVKNENLYPAESDVAAILKIDSDPQNTLNSEADIKTAYQTIKQTLEAQGLGNMAGTFEDFEARHQTSLAVNAKNYTFHYLPYNFGASGSSRLEKNVFGQVLRSDKFQKLNLEIYYNGEPGLTKFVINCYTRSGKYWKPMGKYTTDFIMLKRTDDKHIDKILLIETKGKIYAQDEKFRQKKAYIENEFLEMNRQKFNYKRFDFLYLEDSSTEADNTNKLNQKIAEFFNH